MIPLLYPLPLDWSGRSQHNRTTGELHDISIQSELPYRIMVMEKGYFYTHDLYMIDSRGRVLTEDDYQLIAMNPEIADETKMTACAVIMVTNPNISDFIRIDAQMVGGKYCSVKQAIIEMAANVVSSTNRVLYWKNITDKPDSYRPNGHLHAWWDIFGFKEQTNSLKRITTAIDNMTSKDFNGLFDEFLIEFNQANNGLTDIENRLTTHINDTLDPHKVTAVQLGVGNVVDGPIATQSQAQSGNRNIRNAYTTPLRSKQVIDYNFTPMLTQHIRDTNNPHQDTAAKLGAWTTTQLRVEANKYYNRGDTVQYSSRVFGLDYGTYYNGLRANLPVNQITAGVFPQGSYVSIGRGDGWVLQPTASGYLEWGQFSTLIAPYVRKGNDILFAGTYYEPYNDLAIYGNPVVAAQRLNAFVTRTLGTGFAEGTIAIVKLSKDWSNGTGNGTYVTNVNTTTMTVMQGGRWTMPGFA